MFIYIGKHIYNNIKDGDDTLHLFGGKQTNFNLPLCPVIYYIDNLLSVTMPHKHSYTLPCCCTHKSEKCGATFSYAKIVESWKKA